MIEFTFMVKYEDNFFPNLKEINKYIFNTIANKYLPYFRCPIENPDSFRGASTWDDRSWCRSSRQCAERRSWVGDCGGNHWAKVAYSKVWVAGNENVNDEKINQNENITERLRLWNLETVWSLFGLYSAVAVNSSTRNIRQIDADWS